VERLSEGLSSSAEIYSMKVGSGDKSVTEPVTLLDFPGDELAEVFINMMEWSLSLDGEHVQFVNTRLSSKFLSVCPF